MKNKVLLSLSILISFSFGQFDGKTFEKYLESLTVMVGVNESFHGIEWNDVVEVNTHLIDINQTPFRKLSFALINENKHGLLGGAKYLSYGFDYDFESSIVGSGQQTLQLKFLKLFLTYPLYNRLYLGFEGGYFIEGEERLKNNRGSWTELIQRYHWREKEGFLEFDFGLLGQFHYNINEFLLVTIDGYYGLSKFFEDNDEAIIPNVYHYVNLGFGYKLGKKTK